MNLDFDLHEKRALITGAGQGVGREIALTLGRLGAMVFVNDLLAERADRVAEEIRAAGGAAAAAPFDVTDWDSVLAGLALTGPIDILVNNAGNAGRTESGAGWSFVPFAQTTPDDWTPFLEVNLHGVMHMVRAALPQMVERGGGRIVTIISDAGRVGEPMMAAYAAAKAGAAGFSRAVAREVGRYGITVNCVALGTMRAPGDDERDEALTDERTNPALKKYVVRRPGKPQDAAAMVAFLASPMSSWITGQTYPVNGGYSFAT